MTEDVVTRAKALLAHIDRNPWPWGIERHHASRSLYGCYITDARGFNVANDISARNATFIAAAPQIVNDLCAEVLRLRDELQTIRTA